MSPLPYGRRPRRLLALLLGAILVMTAGLAGVPAPAGAADRPANDDFAAAQVLTGNPATATASNVGATAEFGEPKHAQSGGASVWYSWTAPEAGTATVDPAGSDFDTVVGVYTGTAVDALTEVASVDDNADSVQGKVAFPVAGGTTYAIAVDGFSAATGAVALSVSFVAGATGSISGVVVDRQQSGLAGVCVDAYAAEGVSARRATSDGLGGYRVGGLADGTYRVGFSDCGSGAYPEFYSDAATYDLAQDVPVAGGRETPGVDAQLGLPSDPAAISGRVTDTAGTPLSDVCVNLANAEVNTTWQVRTGADGRYRAEVEPGTFTAEFFPCNLGYPIAQWYDGQTQATATTFVVTTGRETTGIDAAMVIGGQVAGTVTNDLGAALANVCVDLLDPAGVAVQDPVVTSSGGGFRFRDLVPASYVVRYRICRDVGPYVDEYFQDAATLVAATPVVVPTGGTAVADGVLDRVPEPDTVILTGPADGSVTGPSVTFTFASVPAAAAVSFVCTIDARSASACTGSKTYTGLAQGAHTFRVHAVGQAGVRDATPATRSFSVDAVAPDTTIDSGPSGTIAVDAATYEFHGTAGETASLQCRLDDAAWADCASPATFTGLAAGEHTVAFRAVDAVGNVDLTPATRELRVVPPRAVTTLKLTAPKQVKAGKKAAITIRLVGVTSGTVVLRDGKKMVKTITVRGAATVKLLLKPGTHKLVASYAGTATARPSRSAVRTVVVRR